MDGGKISAIDTLDFVLNVKNGGAYFSKSVYVRYIYKAGKSVLIHPVCPQLPRLTVLETSDMEAIKFSRFREFSTRGDPIWQMSFQKVAPANYSVISG